MAKRKLKAAISQKLEQNKPYQNGLKKNIKVIDIVVVFNFFRITCANGLGNPNFQERSFSIFLPISCFFV